jgi:transposase
LRGEIISMPLKPGQSPDPDARPQRRTFTAEFKARILAEYDAAPDAAARGAILRRERLYGSHILDWRKARDAGAAAGLTDRRQSAARAAKKAETAEFARLQRENARLQAELAKTQTALQIMGKAHALLELLSESADTAPTPNPSSPRRSRR